MQLRRLRQQGAYSGAVVDPLAEVVQRVEDARDEPDLVRLRVERPRPAQHDHLDLAGRMADLCVLRPRRDIVCKYGSNAFCSARCAPGSSLR
ncbi:MAG: hypothetical protein HND48_23370 [Chloroflexi bacterium]|nr:hypothetical protein [Chloroflexota bacterium]